MKAQLAVAKTPSLGRLHSVRSSLRARFLERDHVIDLMLAAVLARVHVFVLGPPPRDRDIVHPLVNHLIFFR